MSGQPTEEAARLQKLRAQAMQAFADDDEDDEDNEDLENDLISEQDEQNARAGHVQMRAPGMQLIHTIVLKRKDTFRMLAFCMPAGGTKDTMRIFHQLSYSCYRTSHATAV